jgi:sirohydrochlorin cobaltochelatase
VKTAIVLAMHGAPPLDFPKDEMAEVMSSQHYDGHSEHAEHGEPGDLHDHPVPEQQETMRNQQIRRQRVARLAAKMRAWPRTADNDPFFAGSLELATHLAATSRCDVVVGFNEFCDPTVPAALDLAVAHGAERVVVITPMMTKGGEHSELDISSAVRSAQKRYPGVEIVYAWPFEVTEVAQFLSAQVQRFTD